MRGCPVQRSGDQTVVRWSRQSVQAAVTPSYRHRVTPRVSPEISCVNELSTSHWRAQRLQTHTSTSGPSGCSTSRPFRPPRWDRFRFAFVYWASKRVSFPVCGSSLAEFPLQMKQHAALICCLYVASKRRGVQTVLYLNRSRRLLATSIHRVRSKRRFRKETGTPVHRWWPTAHSAFYVPFLCIRLAIGGKLTQSLAR